MNNIIEVIKAIGRDIKALTSKQAEYLKESKAYELFPTYSTLQSQMTSNIKDKHLELGLDALIDTKLQNGGDPFVTRSKVPTIDTSLLASKNDLEELKRSVGNAGQVNEYEIHGTGMPNGKVTAPVGTTYVDTAVTNGALKWIKRSRTDNQGWEVLTGDTGWQKLRTSSTLGASAVHVRRINNQVTYRFDGLQWGWFGTIRRNGPGYASHPSDRDRKFFILGNGAIPYGFRAPFSLIGQIFNDSGIPYGTWYVGSATDANHLRFQFTDPVPTDRDIGDIRVSLISYVTDDPWPSTL
jgi:hypothetical protein|nr:MAG TPA: hypothetical protein [Caudoviricetes sp.]